MHRTLSRSTPAAPTRIMLAAVTLALALAPARANAQSAASLRRDADASVDRNLLVPTAETIDQGALSFNSYELFFAGLTYGVTDDLQISATVLLPIVRDMPFVGALATKLRLLTAERLRLSIQPSAFVFTDEGITGGLIGGQVLFDWLLDADGDFVLTLAESTNFAWGSGGDDLEFLTDPGFVFAAAFSARVARVAKLMAELTLPGAIADGGLHLVQEALLLNYGVRFFGRSLAVDLSFLRPLHPDTSGPFILGVPFVAFSAKF